MDRADFLPQARGGNSPRKEHRHAEAVGNQSRRHRGSPGAGEAFRADGEEAEKATHSRQGAFRDNILPGGSCDTRRDMYRGSPQRCQEPYRPCRPDAGIHQESGRIHHGFLREQRGACRADFRWNGGDWFSASEGVRYDTADGGGYRDGAAELCQRTPHRTEERCHRSHHRNLPAVQQGAPACPAEEDILRVLKEQHLPAYFLCGWKEQRHIQELHHLQPYRCPHYFRCHGSRNGGNGNALSHAACGSLRRYQPDPVLRPVHRRDSLRSADNPGGSGQGDLVRIVRADTPAA